MQEVETSLDQGYGTCHFRNPRFVQYLIDAIHKFQGTRYFVSCWTIMPNHCHLVIRPFPGWNLEKILQGIKGFVAYRVNADVGKSAEVWQSESYDRIVRDEDHLYRVIQYIGRNSSQAGLDKDEWYRWIDPEWARTGWGFAESLPT